MTNQELQKKAEELEQTLKMQFSVAKHEYADFLKLGAVVVGSALIAGAAVKIFGSKKKKKTQKVLQVLEKEGLLDQEIEHKLTHKSEPGLLGRIGLALLPIAMNYGRDIFLQRLSENNSKASRDDE